MKHDYQDAFSELCSNVSVAIIVIDSITDEIVFINSKVLVDLKKLQEEVLGKSYQIVFSPEFRVFYEGLVSRCDGEKQHSGVYFWNEENLWEQASVKQITWEGRQAILLTITNISEVISTDYRYKRLAYFDGVTKLPNERQLEDDINEIVNVDTINLVFFTIESLNDIYDIYGWSEGDALQVSICEWLQETKLERTLLYKVGDAFVMMGRGITKEDLVWRAHFIRERFHDPWVIPVGEEQFSVYCTVKIGIVSGRYVRNDMSNIIIRTLKMVDREERGYVVYDEVADEAVKRTRLLRHELIDCIYDDMRNFFLEYHPIVDIHTERWVGAEALCRWTSAVEGHVPPLDFIPLVEQLGLIAHVDQWVRHEAMRSCSAIGLNEKEFFLDVNFSPHQAIDDSFVESVFFAATAAEYPLDHLIIEITESERMKFDDRTLEGLEALKRTGIMLSLDDFGSGYSSIENLIKLSASMLKTDKLLVDDLENDVSRQTLMGTLITTTHNLDMHIVVEGVERKEQLEILRDLGADFVQGYYYSKPLTIDQLEAELWRYPDSSQHTS